MNDNLYTIWVWMCFFVAGGFSLLILTITCMLVCSPQTTTWYTFKCCLCGQGEKRCKSAQQNTECSLMCSTTVNPVNPFLFVWLINKRMFLSSPYIYCIAHMFDFLTPVFCPKTPGFRPPGDHHPRWEWQQANIHPGQLQGWDHRELCCR